MLCASECLLLVTLVFVVPVHSNPYEKDIDVSEKLWRASSPNGMSRNGRHLNEHAKDEHSNADDGEIEGNKNLENEASYDRDDQSTNESHSEYERKRDEKKGADHAKDGMERGDDEMEGSMKTKGETRHENDKHSREYSNQTGSAEHYMEKDEGKAEGSRGKNCHGADAKDERPRNLRGHSEQEIEPVSECEEEDNGLGLPVILGIVGAVLVGVFAFGAIFFACSRRRTATKAVLGAGGVVVMGQPVSASTPNDGTNKKGNAPEELAHDNA
jgi:hypothetical protein